MTFSVAGRCKTTGAFGGIVTSSSPAVGARCVRAKAGVGVVLTQNVTDPRLADIGLQALSLAYQAEDALRAMKAATAYPEYRQLAVVDSLGRSGVSTGNQALGVHGEFQAENVVAIGNLLSDPGIPEAMGRRFLELEDLPLTERLIASIEAGFQRGGELDQEHSIGLVVYYPDAPFAYVDLRVDYSESDPLGDLKKLWEIYGSQAEAYKVRALQPEEAPSYGVLGDE